MSTPEWYFTDDGSQVLERSYIKRNLFSGGICERCNRDVPGDHEWIELSDRGVVIKCSFSDTKTAPTENFKEYVSYNEYGGIQKRLPRATVEGWLKLYDETGTLVLGCWELRRSDDGISIEVRLAPQCELDGKDNLWHSFNYSLVPFFG